MKILDSDDNFREAKIPDLCLALRLAIELHEPTIVLYKSYGDRMNKLGVS